MHQPSKLYALFALFIFCVCTNAALAQTPSAAKLSEPSFDVILQTVVASNDAAGKTEVGTSLAGVVKKIKADFSFGNYRLNSTAIQRTVNRGNIEFNNLSYTTDKNIAVFSTWDIDGLESSFDDKGQETIQVQSFRFTQRIPVDNPNTSAVTYEQFGLKTKFGLARNVPTVVGSLPTGKPDELMFLILTVKAADK